MLSYRIFFIFFLLLATQVSFAESKFYKLGAGDKININVYGEDDLSLSDTAIGDEGTIVFPFMGEIKISGLTTAQLEKKITRFLKGDYLINPNVHVFIKEYRPFYIRGQVNAPGGYPYQPGLTIGRAISLGGGFTERAAKNNIFISHPDAPQDRERVKQHDKIKPGDVITVEESFF